MEQQLYKERITCHIVFLILFQVKVVLCTKMHRTDRNIDDCSTVYLKAFTLTVEVWIEVWLNHDRQSAPHTDEDNLCECGR